MNHPHPSPDLALLAEPRRQAPIAVVFLALRALRRIGIAQLVVVVVAFSRFPTGVLLVVVPVIGLIWLASSILAWLRFTFCVADDELRVTKGVLSQERLTVPLERVQSASIEQRLLHRLVDVVNVSVDTAGASQAEFEIDAIERGVAEALQRVVADRSLVRTGGVRLAGQDGSAAAGDVVELAPGDPLPPPVVGPPPVEERQILTRSVRRLVTTGLTRPAFAGLALVFPLAAFGEEVVDLLGVEAPTIDRPDPAAWMLWLIPAAVVLIALLGFVGNLVSILLTEWNLSLTLRDRGFVREAGLLSRRSTATTIDRIQRVEVRRNPLEARFGIQRVALPTVGEGSLRLPGTDDAELAELRGLVLDDETVVGSLDRRISPMGVSKETRNAAVFSLVAVAAFVWTPVGLWALLASVMVPWTWLTSRRRHRLHRWGVVPGGIAQHHQFVTVWTEELMLRKVNGVEVRQSWFERSRGLATVRLKTAQGSLSVGMIPLEEAQVVRDLALMEAETNTKAWM